MAVATVDKCTRIRHGPASAMVLTQVLRSTFVAALLLFNGVASLKDLHLRTPGAVRTGTIVTLRCDYDLQNDPLYTVKWYKGRSEVFRYTPKEHPNTQVFPLEGINVDVHKSDRHQLVLDNAQVSTAGKFRCEVSADASFQTLFASGYLRVVEPPRSGPQIRLEKSRYSSSDRLRANCTVPASLPPVNITWMVNGHLVPNQSVVTHPVNCSGGNSLSTRCNVSSRLELDVQASSFHEGRLRVECVAKLWTLFKETDVRDVYEEKPRLASVLGTRESSSGCSMGSRWRRGLLLLALLASHHR